MKKYAAAFLLVVFALTGCVGRTEIGQRITIVSPAVRSLAPQVERASQNFSTTVPEKAAMESLSVFDLKILAVLRELKAKDERIKEGWFVENKSGAFTYAAYFSTHEPLTVLVLVRINWTLRTIDVVDESGADPGKAGPVAELLANRLRMKLPEARISIAGYRETHYSKFDVSP